MARYPGAVWKPLSTRFSGRERMAAHNRMNLHVAVSEAPSLHGFFNQPDRASSHFYVRKSGVVEQYVDTAYQAEADGDGNDATISVETQGGLRNAQGEKWTSAQVEALAELFAWAVKTHGLKPRLATSSHVGYRSKGLSWHRLGVNGNFPSSGILRGRLQRGGGMEYSPSYGKICPGDAKIRQIPGILRRAKALLKGTSKPKPETKKDWFDMSKYKRTATSKGQRLVKGKYKTLKINDEGHVSLLQGPVEHWDGLLQLRLSGLPAGAEAHVRFIQAAYGGGKRTRIRNTYTTVEVVGTGGDTFAQVAMRGGLPGKKGGQSTRLRVQVKVYQDGVRVKKAEVRLQYR